MADSSSTTSYTARILQALFFVLIVRPLLAIIIGANIRRADRMPTHGPSILAANHNSHLDTLFLMSFYPLSTLYRVRPVAAADYFMQNRVLAWFALNIMHVLPLHRGSQMKRNPLANIEAALENGDILILFPEGSRGEPEKRSALKSGIAHLMERQPSVNVCPIYLHGLGKALPKGDWLPVPFFADVFVGESFAWQGSRQNTMQRLEQAFGHLAAEGAFLDWH